MPRSASSVGLAKRSLIPRKQFYIHLFFFNTVILVSFGYFFLTVLWARVTIATHFRDSVFRIVERASDEDSMKSMGVRALLIVSILGGLNASAQVTAGGLRGLVTDPNGASVADATVCATNMATSITSEGTSTRAGVYVIRSLSVGQYHVETQSKRFQTI